MRSAWGRTVSLAVAFVGLFSMSTSAQQAGTGSEENLAKQLSNPIASLVSVPFQFNWEQNVGPNELTRFILNVQPVMPFTMNENLNLIVRLIAPLISQPPLFDGEWRGSAAKALCHERGGCAADEDTPPCATRTQERSSTEVPFRESARRVLHVQ